MAEELGKIEKPEAESVSGKRKLLVVPMTYYAQNAPEEYSKLFTKYWEQASEHIANLESKVGSINHVYHESIAEAGQEALDIIEEVSGSQLDPKLVELFRRLVVGEMETGQDETPRRTGTLG